MTDFDDFRAAAAAEGFAAETIDAWLELARPYVVLSTDARHGGPVAGRLGGLPTLTGIGQWPTFGDDRRLLPLSVTVDCAALPRHGLAADLPASGLLQFFIEYDDLYGDPDPFGDEARVLHVDDPSAAERKAGPDEVDVYESRDLYIWTGYDFPHFSHEEFDVFEEREPRAEALFALATRTLGVLEGGDSIQIGGYPAAAHGEPTYDLARLTAEETGASDADLDARYRRDYRFLAQFDLLDDINDAVTARFLIRHDDLAAARFDRVASLPEFGE
ncbi:YwqG family protein [Actinoplanes sp. NPDC051851]|uniref:YwqG family protein n=1 Tax=Actinoplanes sp. NPDC051851 TaxID=3154753 RepID=UPI00343EE933